LEKKSKKEADLLDNQKGTSLNDLIYPLRGRESKRLTGRGERGEESVLGRGKEGERAVITLSLEGGAAPHGEK